MSGNATLYTSNQWTSPAIAKLDNLRLMPHSDQLVPNLEKGKIAATSVFVPVDYKLSFNITPFEVNPQAVSIFDYSATHKEIGQLPRLSYDNCFLIIF